MNQDFGNYLTIHFKSYGFYDIIELQPLKCNPIEYSIIMNFRMTKKDAVQQFRWDWADFVKSNPNFRGDSIAKRCAFNDYVDGLNKDGLVTDYQAYNWSNPF